MKHPNQTWQRFTRKVSIDLRMYVPGEDLSEVEVDEAVVPELGGFIAREAAHPEHQWYMDRESAFHRYEPAGRRVWPLYFLNPVYAPGLNVTVRRGHKWWDMVKPGDLVFVRETGKPKTLVSGVVIGAYPTTCEEIPEEVLEKEHDPDCRNLGGLLEAMHRAYGDFEDDDEVSVLVFDI